MPKLSAGEITIRFKQILDKSFLSKRMKLRLVKFLLFLSTLIPYLETVSTPAVPQFVLVPFLYVHTHITSC